jgi:hypothetical protein
MATVGEMVYGNADFVERISTVAKQFERHKFRIIEQINGREREVIGWGYRIGNGFVIASIEERKWKRD